MSIDSNHEPAMLKKVLEKRKRHAMRKTLCVAVVLMVVGLLGVYSNYLGMQEVCNVKHCYDEVATIGKMVSGIMLVSSVFAMVCYFMQRSADISKF